MDFARGGKESRMRIALLTPLATLACVLLLGCGGAESFEGAVRIPASTGEGASWSPDGSRLAIPDSHGILLRDVATGGRRQIEAPPLRNGLAEWTQDGSTLRYLTTAGPEKGRGSWLTEVGADGAGLRQYPLDTILYEGTWAPADWPLVFATGPYATDLEKGPVGPRSELLAVDAWGSPPRPFLDLAGQEGQPSFSPDGSRIMFTLSRHEISLGLWVAEAGGTRPRPLVKGLINCAASWSPDGRWVVFSATTFAGDRRHHLYAVPADGGRMRELTPEEVRWDGPPAWTPDGRWVAYATFDGTIERIRPRGGRPQEIADFPDQEVRNLMWSPDGRHLAFSAEPIVETD
jgi:Tol biopolymer transport system component